MDLYRMSTAQVQFHRRSSTHVEADIGVFSFLGSFLGSHDAKEARLHVSLVSSYMCVFNVSMCAHHWCFSTNRWQLFIVPFLYLLLLYLFWLNTIIPYKVWNPCYRFSKLPFSFEKVIYLIHYLLRRLHIYRRHWSPLKRGWRGTFEKYPVQPFTLLLR